jgi:Fic family protein
MSNEITDWVAWFVKVIIDAQLQAKELLEFTIKKTKFFDKYKSELNQRQLKALRKMWEAPGGFKGGMTANKYISITKASKATATRDLQLLVVLGVILIMGAGRSTHYVLKMI